MVRRPYCESEYTVDKTTFQCGLLPHAPSIEHEWPGTRFVGTTGSTRTVHWHNSAADRPRPDDPVNHPGHYGGADNPYEAIKVIEAWGLGFALGNAVKYISRAGKKMAAAEVEDLKKARWYLDRRISQLEVDE